MGAYHHQKDQQFQCLGWYAQVMLNWNVTIKRFNMHYHLFKRVFRLVNCQLAMNDITQ